MDSLTWKILGGILGILGMGAFLGWYFQEFLKAYLPPPRWLSDRAKQRDLPLPKGERLVVLIADLEGDDESRSHTRHVFAALEPYHGLDIHRIGPAARFEFTSRDELEEKASALLKARGGDVLVWGDVASAGKGVRLRILAAGPQVRSDRPSVEGRRPGEYTLTETGLPLEFDRDFDAIIVALVLGAVAPATERQGHYLVEVLKPVAGRLKHLCAYMPAGLDADKRGALWHSLGLAADTLGEQSGESSWLEEAVAAYRAALEVYTRERVPLDWAMTQNNRNPPVKAAGQAAAGRG